MKNTSSIRTEYSVNFLKNLYNLSKIEVLGLFIGSRTTKYFINFCNQFNLQNSLCEEISLNALKSFIQLFLEQLLGGGKFFEQGFFVSFHDLSRSEY